jgi:hypothetical protein
VNDAKKSKNITCYGRFMDYLAFPPRDAGAFPLFIEPVQRSQLSSRASHYGFKGG